MLHSLGRVRIRHLILLFGLVNACLYSALLPLWEGFDEAFHYGYVETLWQTARLPVLGRTLLPGDVSESFNFAPVSHVVNRAVANATPYNGWFNLPRTSKEERRHHLNFLRAIPTTSQRPNYEAHHPPFAYVLLALIDKPASAASLPARVLLLRLFGAVSGILLLYAGMIALCRTLEIPPPFANAFIFTVLCSQMLYATIAHVANDWLAVGLSAVFLAALAGLARQPTRRSALTAAAWLAAGLLTKAYFLVFALLAVGVAATLVGQRRARLKSLLPAFILVFALAGPWYVRNVVLYGNVSGTQEELDGIGIRQALAAAPHIDWLSTTGYLARGSLWTGNNSFTTFSRGTLNLTLALLFLAIAAWILEKRKARSAEWVLVAATGVFSIGLAYATCASFADTRGESAGASPWYTQVLLAPLLALAYLGMSRRPALGPLLASCTAGLWTWVLIATWLVKLFPLYSGAPDILRANGVWNWYLHGAFNHARDLSLLALLPAPWLYAGLVISLALTVFLIVRILKDLRSPGPYLRKERSA